ncbi:pyridoxal phosphate-dependent transferase [Dactylonectria macrodidyma]|uniref:Pyridoxal phosphate-dependent transferase n=1 Tax=Dactylonectria macrodidyma TaxID=307937 RepID=A0A9P9F6Z9_9HYPO|nr:pyridoxal phosphate-dependent transferase [Dactylonectria macrodidyma]
MAPSKSIDIVEDNVSTETMALKTAKPTSATSPNFSAYRQLVPLVASDGVTYLNASFAPPSNLIIHDAITRYSTNALHNPHPKPEWQAIAVETRKLISRYINAESPESVALMRDTTEGLNSFIRSLKFDPGDNVVLLDSEHPNHAYGWMALRASGLEVRQIPSIPETEKTGNVTTANAETFAPYVDSRTRAIGLSSIMFHSGQWNDVAGICAAFRPKGIQVLVDMTQQVGFAPVDVQALGISAAAFGMHKGLNCPTGFAALYVNPAIIKDIDPTPPIVGYGAVSNVRADLLVPSDEIIYHPSAQRYEHLNISLVAAVAAKAYLKFYLDIMGPKNVEAHLYSLGDVLRQESKTLGIKVVGPESRREHAPHLYILDLHDSRWAQHLRESGVYVTPYRLGVRVSFGFYNNVADVKTLVVALKAGLEMGLPLGKD